MDERQKSHADAKTRESFIAETNAEYNQIRENQSIKKEEKLLSLDEAKLRKPKF
jgi:hypothetical protein